MSPGDSGGEKVSSGDSGGEKESSEGVSGEQQVLPRDSGGEEVLPGDKCVEKVLPEDNSGEEVLPGDHLEVLPHLLIKDVRLTLMLIYDKKGELYPPSPWSTDRLVQYEAHCSDEQQQHH